MSARPWPPAMWCAAGVSYARPDGAAAGTALAASSDWVHRLIPFIVVSQT